MEGNASTCRNMRDGKMFLRTGTTNYKYSEWSVFRDRKHNHKSFKRTIWYNGPNPVTQPLCSIGIGEVIHETEALLPCL